MDAVLGFTLYWHTFLNCNICVLSLDGSTLGNLLWILASSLYVVCCCAGFVNMSNVQNAVHSFESAHALFANF